MIKVIKESNIQDSFGISKETFKEVQEKVNKKIGFDTNLEFDEIIEYQDGELRLQYSDRTNHKDKFGALSKFIKTAKIDLDVTFIDGKLNHGFIRVTFNDGISNTAINMGEI